ncbi:MAG: hypothetical protein GY796_23005 [Chloroflexi bacterium]|nr:hypothetical protein [Chloroflexota bacterium]
MITNGGNTVESLRHIRNLVVIPQLFKEPKEGYVDWLQSNVDDPGSVGKGTIPHRILNAEGEARYYGTLLPRIISGAYEEELLTAYLEDDDAAARAVQDSDSPGELERIANNEHLPLKIQWAAAAKNARLLFDSSKPVYIGIYKSVERYRDVEPVLTYLKNGAYVAGGPKLHHRFQATEHEEAIGIAREWFIEQREEEIKRVKKEATKMDVPRLIVDLLGIILERDDAILDEMGTRIAWKNGGIHGRFGVMALGWCYIMRCAPNTAGRLLAIAQQEAGKHDLHAPLQLNLAGNVSQYLRLKPIEDGLSYAGGMVKAHPKTAGVYGVFKNGDSRPFAQVKVGKKETVVMDTSNGKPKEIARSPVPASWGLTELDKAAWGAWVGLKRRRKKK